MGNRTEIGMKWARLLTLVLAIAMSLDRALLAWAQDGAERPLDLPGLVIVVGGVGGMDIIGSCAESALPRVATEPAKLERPPMRPRRVVRRDDDGPRVREAAAGERRPRYASGPVWHRSNGGGGMGVVLGVGY